jgi:molecular chaperone DnaK
MIVDWLAEDFLAKEGVDLRRDRQSLQRLSEAAEKAKIELSGVPVTEINLPFITATADGPKHIETKLERSHFEEICGDLVSRMRGPLKQALADAGITPNQVDEVVLVGGASRMPMVQDLVRSVMNREPNRNVNPDEVVAVGAAIQAGILTQEVKDILLLDVSPLSLGVETIGGVMKKLIPRNTTIPVRRSDTFSTSENNQTVVEVHIIQGEREMAADNKSLGRFKLMGIPPAPRGIPQVQVSFDIDANGILQVSALDKTTGRQQSITVQEASNLSESDIQAMIRAAEENAATDRLQRERIEKKNRAEVLTYKAERVLREVAIDFGLQFARDRRRRIEGLVQALRAALEQSDERGIDIAQSDLQNEVYEINREAYLYDLDEEGDGILGQIGSTIKRAFSGEDDDYYRTGDNFGGYDGGYGGGYPPAGSSWDRQAQWDAPAWNRGGASSSSSWDDWDDDWEKSRNAPASGPDRYDRDQGYGRNGADLNRTSNQSDYRRDDYRRDSYPQDDYPQERYPQDSYPQDNYPQERYPQDNYDQGYDQRYRDERAQGGDRYSGDRYRGEYQGEPADPYRQDRAANSGANNGANNRETNGSLGRRDDRYAPQSDSYGQSDYERDSYSRDGYGRDGRDGYSQGNDYSQDSYDRGGASLGNQQDYGRGDYRADYRPDYRAEEPPSRSPYPDSSRGGASRDSSGRSAQDNWSDEDEWF